MPRSRPSPSDRISVRAARPVRGRRAALAAGPVEPASEHGRQTRDRILDAAIALIAERGFAATSIDALCQRADVVRTAIYWHFGAKEGLVVPVVERVATSWIEEIQSAVYGEGDPFARLDRFVDGLRTLVLERPHLVRLLLAVALERADQDPATRDALRSIFERARAAIVQGFDDSLGGPWSESGLIASTALAFVSHAIAQQLVDPRPEEVERRFAELRTAIVLMIGARLHEVVRTAPEGESR
jgi:AcrR family transcriptional regulator